MAISLQRVIRSTSCLVLGWGFWGTADGAIYGSNKSKMAATAMLEKFQVAISPQPVVRSTSCFVLGWGFRIRRYIRFEQIQDGGHRHVGKISSGDISATSLPTHFMFCSRVVFFGDGGSNDGAISGSNKSKMAAAVILEKFQMAISPQLVVRSTSCLVIGWGFR